MIPRTAQTNPATSKTSHQAPASSAPTSSVLGGQLDLSQALDKTGEVGYVTRTMGPVVHIEGLPGVRPYELLIFEKGQQGVVFSLSDNQVEAIMLSIETVTVGEQVARTDHQLDVATGDFRLGTMVDALGVEQRSIGAQATNSANRKENGKEKIDQRPMFGHSPQFIDRSAVDEPLGTGVIMVDTVIPLGKGQRQLVIGDRRTGKTEFLQQVMRSLVQQGMICVYAGLGKRSSDVIKTWEYFKQAGLLGSMVMVQASAAAAPGMIYLAPYTAMAIAEHFRDQGKDVILVLDDLTAHAKNYREIALLANRFPGRNSYPGDIFFIHSQLMERAGKTRIGSITCLPVAETYGGDLSGYVQTNLMSMTDGHIFFDGDFYNQGRRPAINPFLSVTRVGRQTLTPLLKELNQKVTSFMIHLRELRQFMHFGAELKPEIVTQLDMGNKLEALLDQGTEIIIPLPLMTYLLVKLFSNEWKQAGVDEVCENVVLLRNTYQQVPEFRAELEAWTQTTSFADAVLALKKLTIPHLSTEQVTNGNKPVASNGAAKPTSTPAPVPNPAPATTQKT